MKKLQLICAIMMGLVSLFLVIGTVLASPVPVPADTTLSGKMTVDNDFTAYIDTSDAWSQWGSGTNIGSGNDWPNTYTVSGLLTPGTQYFLHVIAGDYGVVAGFKGKFTLGDSQFEFANNAQTLVTDVNAPNAPVNNWWKVYELKDNALNPLTLTLASYSGSNWMNQHDATIGADAKWIWTNSGYDVNTMRYFSTPITPVPEPISSTLFLLGVGALGLRTFRKRKNSKS